MHQVLDLFQLGCLELGEVLVPQELGITVGSDCLGLGLRLLSLPTINLASNRPIPALLPRSPACSLDHQAQIELGQLARITRLPEEIEGSPEEVEICVSPHQNCCRGVAKVPPIAEVDQLGGTQPDFELPGRGTETECTQQSHKEHHVAEEVSPRCSFVQGWPPSSLRRASTLGTDSLFTASTSSWYLSKSPRVSPTIWSVNVS